jgi:hypothetical protein
VAPSYAPRARLAAVIAAAVTAALAVVGTAAWQVGFFADRGRYPHAVDACPLMTDAAAAAVLPAPRLDTNPHSSYPARTLFGWGGDERSECRWEATGQATPFQAMRLVVERRVHNGRTGAATRGRALFTEWRHRAQATGGQVQPVPGLGEEAFAISEKGSFLWNTWYDEHVRFRVSNLLIDISARTQHTSPQTDRLIGQAAQSVAARLAAQT